MSQSLIKSKQCIAEGSKKSQMLDNILIIAYFANKYNLENDMILPYDLSHTYIQLKQDGFGHIKTMKIRSKFSKVWSF